MTGKVTDSATGSVLPLLLDRLELLSGMLTGPLRGLVIGSVPSPLLGRPGKVSERVTELVSGRVSGLLSGPRLPRTMAGLLSALQFRLRLAVSGLVITTPVGMLIAKVIGVIGAVDPFGVLAAVPAAVAPVVIGITAGRLIEVLIETALGMMLGLVFGLLFGLTVIEAASGIVIGRRIGVLIGLFGAVAAVLKPTATGVGVAHKGRKGGRLQGRTRHHLVVAHHPVARWYGVFKS